MEGRRFILSCKEGTLYKDFKEKLELIFKEEHLRFGLIVKLDTAGIYDVGSLREGKDFIADLVNLFDVEGKRESFADLKEVLKPAFETWQGKKYLHDLSDEEMKDFLVQAKSLCLDKLLK